MATFEERTNETFDLAVYLQLMGAFVPGVDFSQVKQIVLSTYDFLKKSPQEEIRIKLPQLKSILEKMANPLIERYPPKKSISEIAKLWNDLFKDGKDVFSYGITYGWLEELMDLKSLYLYDHVPYHFRIGLVAHKGNGGIEEEFLLKDAFNSLAKAENYFNILLKYGELKKQEEAAGKEFNKETYKQITDIKYEVAAFSRLTIISFYAFIECFVNSVGFSFLQRNKNDLNEDEIEVLQGLKKGRFLTLKSKIERFQRIIRTDKKAIIITSDEKQMKEAFLSFFYSYEELRNSSVHYSPLKEQIWLKPEEWLEKARTFSKISIEVGLEFWMSCHGTIEGPQYLENLEYEPLYNAAKQRLSSLESIQFDILKNKTGYSIVLPKAELDNIYEVDGSD